MRPSRRNTTGKGDVNSSLSSNYDSVFVHRKNALYRRAAELTAITDCEIAIVVLSPEGELSQFSTAPMKKILRTYSRLCSLPHEIHTMQSIQEKLKCAGKDGLVSAGKKDGHGKPLSKQTNNVTKKVKKSAKGDDAWETVEAILSMGAKTNEARPMAHGSSDEEHAVVAVGNGLAAQIPNVDANNKEKRRLTESMGTSQKKHRLSKMDGPCKVEEEEQHQPGQSSEEGTPKQRDSPVGNGRSSRKNMDIGTPLSKKQKPIPPSVDGVSLIGPDGMEKNDSDPSSECKISLH